jgi:hypothetical protein
MAVLLLNLKKGKNLLHPQPMRVGIHHHPTYENEFFYSLKFLKHDKSPPESILKNHSKSQKNHKIENQIVLDFKLIGLCREHTILNALVHIFCCNFRSILFSITVKNILNILYYMFTT